MNKKTSKSSTGLNDIFSFILDGLKEVNPWHNIKIMHTNIGNDIMSGIVVAIIALPLALAFGVGSGLGAVTGIWGAVAGGVIGGIFGGSKIGVSGPTGPKMVQLAAIMVGFRLASGEPDLSAAFSIIFLSGVILVGLSFLRISRLIYYTPYSVVAGFMCGIGVIVILLEFNLFFGVDAAKNVMDSLFQIPYAIQNAKFSEVMVSVPTLVILFIWPVLGKKYAVLKKFPAPLVALLVGTGIAMGFALDVAIIGSIPKGLPQLYWPDTTKFGEYLVPAASLAGLAVFDSLLTCVVADHLSGEKHSSDREVFGQGLANMTAGVIGGLTTATATMRTVANLNSGGKTPLASVVHGLVLMAFVLGLGFVVENIPMAVLAAILIKVGIDILDYRILPVLHRLPLTDMIVFWVVFVVTIVEDLLVAMGVGIVLAFFRFVQEMSKVYKHQVVYLDKVEADLLSTELKNKIKVLKPQGPLFFGSIEPLEETYKKADHHDVLVVDLGAVTMVDLSGAYALEDLIIKARGEGKDVFICNCSPEIESVLRRIKVVDHLGEGAFFNIAEDAIIQAQEYELVNLTHRHIVEQTGEPITTDRQKIKEAASYFHYVMNSSKEKSRYEGNAKTGELFSKVIEDFLICPEIHEIKVFNEKDNSILLKCHVTDDFRVESVKIELECMDGRLLEEGEAVKEGDSDIWKFKSNTNLDCEKGLKIRAQAMDGPGNKAMKELMFKLSVTV